MIYNTCMHIKVVKTKILLFRKKTYVIEHATKISVIDVHELEGDDGMSLIDLLIHNLNSGPFYDPKKPASDDG